MQIILVYLLYLVFLYLTINYKLYLIKMKEDYSTIAYNPYLSHRKKIKIVQNPTDKRTASLLIMLGRNIGTQTSKKSMYIFFHFGVAAVKLTIFYESGKTFTQL